MSAAPPPSGPQSENGAPVAEGSVPESGDGHLAWRRLSPRMLVIHPVQELLRAAPALIGILVAGAASSGNGSLWSLAGVGVVVVLGVLRWFATTYRVTPGQVQIRRGLLRRRTLTVPRDRVRSVDVSANAMHRLLGLARVDVGTGRSDRRNADALKLDALRAPEASRLREELLHHRGGTTNSSATPAASSVTPPASGTTSGAPMRPGAVGSEVELARLAPGWVRYAPFTLSGIVTVGVVTGFLARLASEAHVDPLRFGPLRDVTGQLARASSSLWLVIVALGLVFLAVVAASSTAGYVLAFWGFRLSRDTTGGTLHVTRGLVSTRATTIEERRLRGIEFSEPLLLRAAGGARCIAIATGLRVGRGAERGGSLLLPPAPRREARRVAAQVLGGREEPVISPLTNHGPRALRRRYSRALTVCTLVVAALALLWWQALLPAWTWESSLALFPAGAIVARDRYRNLGHAVVGGCLVSSRGSLVRRRCVLFGDGIIGWNLRRSFFQRRAGLATLTATTAAGRQRYPVQDVRLGEALRVAEEAVPGLLTPFLVPEAPGEERQGPGWRQA